MARTWYLNDEGQRSAFIQWVAKLDVGKPWEIIVKPYRDRRSNEANRRYWAIVGMVAFETGHDKDEIHEFFKQKFLGDGDVVLAGERQPVARSTARLRTDEFCGFMEQCEAWTATNLGLVLS